MPELPPVISATYGYDTKSLRLTSKSLIPLLTKYGVIYAVDVTVGHTFPARILVLKGDSILGMIVTLQLCGSELISLTVHVQSSQAAPRYANLDSAISSCTVMLLLCYTTKRLR